MLLLKSEKIKKNIKKIKHKWKIGWPKILLVHFFCWIEYINSDFFGQRAKKICYFLDDPFWPGFFLGQNSENDKLGVNSIFLLKWFVLGGGLKI